LSSFSAMEVLLIKVKVADYTQVGGRKPSERI
jgi:hypothetical protein